MNKISYRSKLLTVISILYIIATIILYDFLTTFESSNVGSVSKNNFKNKTLEREIYIKDFFTTYFTTIEAIKEDKNFKNYLADGISQEIIENYFLTIKKSLPCLTQVRYIDKEANEIIKVSGTPVNIFGENAVSNLVPKNELQNKSHRDYIQRFFLLEEDEIGLSKINLNKENNKIVLPKQPILRLAMKVYDKNEKYKGLVVLNICLRTFFKQLNKTILYYVHLIDNEGRFLNHHDKRYGITGDIPGFSIKDEFRNEWKTILSNDEYFGETFFSYKLKEFKNKQNIRIILELKFDKLAEERMETEKNLIIYFFIFMIVSMILIIYFSNLPDTLKKEFIKNELLNSQTKLPNRKALLKELDNKEFETSIIILISINNLLIIQNNYGHKVSNIIISKFAKLLKAYKDKNIQKVYINGFNIFTIKYKYSDTDTLNSFLNNFLIAFDNKIISIGRNKQEFSLDISLGVSDPEKLNNGINELLEAENALENALDKQMNLDIFSPIHNKNMNIQRETIEFTKDVKKAIEKKDVVLNYQAIFNNKTNKIDKYECLGRLKVDDEIVFPDKFLPILKRIKKYNQFSMLILDKAIEFFKDKEELSFSINLSVKDISNKEFSSYLIKKVKETNIGSRLVLEIVEQEGIENYEEFYKFIKDVKALGCKIAIDDFGSGYSNFEYIIKMNEYIDFLKIDGSLIKEILTDENTIVLIQSIVFLCDKLEIKTIGEYVENEEIQNYLKSLSIDYSQGYFIGKPQDKLL